MKFTPGCEESVAKCEKEKLTIKYGQDKLDTE